MKSNQVVLLRWKLARRYIKSGITRIKNALVFADVRDNPDIVVGVHKDFINAGSKVLSLNNYAATPSRLERVGMRDSFDDPLFVHPVVEYRNF